MHVSLMACSRLECGIGDGGTRALLPQVAKTNMKNMEAAHTQTQAALKEERRLAAVWRAQLDAQDKRRQEEFDAPAA